MSKKSLAELREQHDGRLPIYAWPGGYPLYYMDDNNLVLCPDCANKPEEEYSSPITRYDMHLEGPPLECEDCGAKIDSAYGDPDEEKDNPQRGAGKFHYDTLEEKRL